MIRSQYLLLHDRDTDPVGEVERVLAGFDAVGADVLVLSAITGLRGYDSRPELDTARWNTLLGNLDRLSSLAAERGVRAVLHPHVGTMVETSNDVQMVLAGSSISLCLDTGHLLIGGTDPAALTRQAPDRIAHTHLKDVDDALAKRVRAGELTYTEAVRAGMSQADAVLDKLARRTGQTAFLSFPRSEAALCIRWAEGSAIGVLVLRPGRSLRQCFVGPLTEAAAELSTNLRR